MSVGRSHVTCKLCNRIFTNVVTHNICGDSFDLDCIKKETVCPGRNCGKPVNSQDFSFNYVLINIINDYRETLGDSFHLYLLDTSTSMRRSDHWLFGLIGASRFDQAKHFLNTIFEEEKSVKSVKIDIICFVIL